MTEGEIELSMKMITYSIFGSKKTESLTTAEVFYHLGHFFEENVLDEAKRRIIYPETTVKDDRPLEVDGAFTSLYK